MNPPTKAYVDLQRGLAKARKIAWRVPKTFPTNDSHELKVRSLILLAHSTFEEYLEELSREIATESASHFVATGQINLPLYALISYHKSSLAETFNYPSQTFSFKDGLLSSVKEALDKHEDVIDGNHGIKPGNYNKLLFPIGLNAPNVDPTIPALLEGFGTKRGGVAHSIQIKVAYTRSDIELDIRNILSLLKSLDDAACIAFNQTLHMLP